MHARTRLGLVAALATLVFSTLAAAQTAVTLTPGFVPDPQRLAGLSGGPVQASSINPSCRGWISQQPNHAINVQSGFAFLRTFVESQQDTTLVIRAPNGQFMCADDTYGLNPGLDAAFGPGQYLVWVGSYAQGNQSPYSIAFSELRTSRPAGAAGGGTTAFNGGAGAGGSFTVAGGLGGPIVDNHTTTSTALVARPCTVNTLAINVRGRHTFKTDLVVSLRSPAGQTEILVSHQRNPFGRHNTSSFAGTPAAGVWTLSVEDTVAADSGFLNGFTLSFTCQ